MKYAVKLKWVLVKQLGTDILTNENSIKFILELK